MKVILTQDVKKLGRKDDVVEVSDGYGRNYLLPRGLAVEATPENLKKLEKKKEAQERQYKLELEQARKLADKIAQSAVEIRTKVGEKGKLFGSVTSKEIASALERELGIKVDKRKIELPEPIKAIGKYSVNIKLHPEVEAKVEVNVIEG
ncbi:50S ribosomal protein L9 [Calderihabitans maritimus]|uniref:Large ribosomal subunit protein bL9 n=1 Tax=Calderihabitans maritimus TaxID=1246530 RepID=A0A1Z5HW22_9FIRM|nr:50S ribosomal protein L9 [Calderihabitans maritimus]GAW93714.1 50S ribosomal protein L9 [Calderihabitans maritimus]